MTTAPAEPDLAPTTSAPRLSARRCLALAVGFGIAGGFLDVGLILLKRDVFHAGFYYRQSRDFPWIVPLATLTILLVPGLLVAGLNRLRPGLITPRAAVWVLATLSLWCPLLRLPIYGWSSLILAFGLAGPIGDRVMNRVECSPRMARFLLASLLISLVGIAAATFGRRTVEEIRGLANRPAPPEGSPNVLLIVLDTVRAKSLGLHGAARPTTPNLERWTRRGVRFDRAIAPAPWTFPSHGTLFTGQWPYKLKSHWEMVLDPGYPTLAGYLSQHGYRTAGFVANTSFCTYESGLNRGFQHYEDYPLTPRNVLGSTVAGRWIVSTFFNPQGAYGRKWIDYQSRDALGINRAFLRWLDPDRPAERPFFAFLNYLDAHEPFVLPEGHTQHFGLHPRSPGAVEMLMNYWELDKIRLGPRETALARDSYEDCIALLDRRVGALLDDLDRRGILANTLVIITSDHGEEFGEHGVFNHGYSLFLPEIHVPLVILPPKGAGAAGTAVARPISLRDLPVTVVDVLGIAGDSPFPGRSLADLWRSDSSDAASSSSPAISEALITYPLQPSRGPGPTQRGYTMSLLTDDRHYILDSGGAEWLSNPETDPDETHNLSGFVSPGPFRTALLRQLTADPPRFGPVDRSGLAAGSARADLTRYRMLLETLVRSPVRGAGSPDAAVGQTGAALPGLVSRSP